ncbi:n6-adenosine-methyltransferase 70 kda subunit [Nannochloropsis oceanica]
METELARYLVRHHGQQQDLPLDLASLHRKLRRHVDGDQTPDDDYPSLVNFPTPEDLLPAVRKLVEHQGVDMDTLDLGSKTLVMLTRVHLAPLEKYLLLCSEGPSECTGKSGAVGCSITQQTVGVLSTATFSLPSPASISPRDASATSFSIALTSPSHDIAALLEKPTALEASAVAHFKKDAPSVREYCVHGTLLECERQTRTAATILSGGSAITAAMSTAACSKLHFRRVIESHTDVSLGDCAYLSGCRRMRTCKYIHYEIEEERNSHGDSCDRHRSPGAEEIKGKRGRSPALPHQGSEGTPGMWMASTTLPTTPPAPAQWVNVDVCNFELSILGQFPVIMADPPWEIHMDLPYGTMSDDEVCKLNFPKLQVEGGLLFLWVTGRAMERAREIFDYWGYRQLEEIIWIKTNQLQKVIRTGRTGHWLNHSKEHCLVGVKGNFVTTGLHGAAGRTHLNRYVDCDVIVAEVRETSRKPDEIYDIIERMCPGARKIEIFGRKHNIREGWITVGNQLPPTHLIGEALTRFRRWEAAKQAKGR